jgi:hypothetical protein
VNRLVVGLLLAALMPAAVLAQEADIRLQSTVTGNLELPRVMYIVPWRQPGDVEFSLQPEPGIAGELLQPVHRDEYLRAMKFRQQTEAGGANAQPTDIIE